MGCEVAVKQIFEDLALDEALLEDTKREAKLMSQLRYPHIAAFIGICEKEGTR